MNYKTNQDFYNDLPEHIKHHYMYEFVKMQAKAYIPTLLSDYLKKPFENQASFFSAFSLSHTSRGYTYWKNLADGITHINFKSESNNITNKEQILQEIKELQEKVEKIKQYVKQFKN